MLVFSAADFEDILAAGHGHCSPSWKSELKAVMDSPSLGESLAVSHTYDLQRDIERALNVYEEVNRGSSFRRPALVLRSLRNNFRPQHRAREGPGRRYRRAESHGFPGRIFRRAVRLTTSQTHAADPPHAGNGCSVGAGTDATRVSSYNPYPFPLLAYTGKRPSGGLSLYPQENRLDREEALSSPPWGAVGFNRRRKKGSSRSGQLADLGGSLWRLFFHTRGGDQASRIGYLRSSVGRSSMPATNLKTRTASAASEPRLSPVKEYGGYAKTLATLLVYLTPLPVSMSRHRQMARMRSHLQCWANLAYGGWVGTALRSDSRVPRGIEMKILFLSFIVGLGVGVLTDHPGKESGAAIVALLGLLGMVLGEQFGTWDSDEDSSRFGAASVALSGETLRPAASLRDSLARAGYTNVFVGLDVTNLGRNKCA